MTSSISSEALWNSKKNIKEKPEKEREKRNKVMDWQTDKVSYRVKSKKRKDAITKKNHENLLVA